MKKIIVSSSSLDNMIDAIHDKIDDLSSVNSSEDIWEGSYRVADEEEEVVTLEDIKDEIDDEIAVLTEYGDPTDLQEVIECLWDNRMIFIDDTDEDIIEYIQSKI